MLKVSKNLILMKNFQHNHELIAPLEIKNEILDFMN